LIENTILCELRKIIISETQDQQVILLQEANGERSFPIIIGFFEAHAIDRKIKEVQSSRPMTHDLLYETIKALGAHLEKIIISELRDSVFYANLVLKQDEKKILVDARPSDAIALAVYESTPIYVAKAVLEEVCGNEEI
jgi:bifunctional DNase/RNase